MNDPHVTALHYWVNHDDSVDYENAQPIECEHGLFYLHVIHRQVTITLKDHYASEEEARATVEGFIHQWEFEAALHSGSSKFSLAYSGADVIDRNPTPPPPGTVEARATFRAGHSTFSARVRVGKTSYPSPPSGPKLRLDIPVVQTMLSQLEMYHKRRALLASMAYFCLTALEGSIPKNEGGSDKDQRTRDYYAISRKVLRQVRNLASTRGGPEARKGDGVNRGFNKEERAFLVAAVQAFIRRAAEKATNPGVSLKEITMADFPGLRGAVEAPARTTNGLTMEIPSR